MVTRIQSTESPQTIQKLGNGTYYYNYDIQPVEVNNLTEEGELENTTQYSFIQVHLSGQPNYKDCVKAIIRAFLTIDEEFDLINSYNSYIQNLMEDSSAQSKYEQYLNLLLQIKQKVKTDFEQL